jgi:serine/threonine protein kinase
MHKKGFIHDDIKPENILLDSDDDETIFCVLSDFGNVKIMKSAEVGISFSCRNISIFCFTWDTKSL